MFVELIGPVYCKGTSGPQNGMFALQKELNKLIEGGLDWFSIKSLPVSKKAIPWFWHWSDREYAARWSSKGLPFFQGPNMLFLNSATPRIDDIECKLLDSPNCIAMFCQSDWYSDLIKENRSARNKSEIVVWPYLIDTIPEGPLFKKYDLLIYIKNGPYHRLLERLLKSYPNNVQIVYGQYTQEDLFLAARQSRVCAYLADDDHGPLALQEILLTGCPTVGVRTGAPFVEDGKTGFLLDNLTDQKDFDTFIKAINKAKLLNCDDVRSFAKKEFSATKITSKIISALKIPD